MHAMYSAPFRPLAVVSSPVDYHFLLESCPSFYYSFPAPLRGYERLDRLPFSACPAVQCQFSESMLWQSPRACVCVCVYAFVFTFFSRQVRTKAYSVLTASRPFFPSAIRTAICLNHYTERPRTGQKARLAGTTSRRKDNTIAYLLY